MGFMSGSIPLICTLAGSLVLGIVYSTDIPFLRWKKYPVLAAGCILAVRAVAVQLGFYLHAFMYTPYAELEGVGLPKLATLLQGPLGFTVAFMLFFSIVIALFKDIPDTKGDIKVCNKLHIMFALFAFQLDSSRHSNVVFGNRRTCAP
jgi:homogentisate phytyltransferase/homogentisate geranylgeranyltransferase